jgi:two-component system response regulator
MTEESVDILLVEDSEDDAAFFQRALKEAGLAERVRHVRDGVEALACVFGANGAGEGTPLVRPRLIVVDLKMPRVNGMEVLQRLKANPHTRTIPVVVWSSSREKRDLVAAYQLGASSYLIKPMDFDELGDLIQIMGRYWLQYNQAAKS